MFELIQEIKKRLAEINEGLNKIELDLNSLRGIHGAIFMEEYLVFESKLETILNGNPDNIRASFKGLCVAQSTSRDESISFADNPNTTTNLVLFMLAKMLFEPKNLKELLSILMPQLTHCVQLSIPAMPTGHMTLAERKAIHNGQQPIITIAAIDTLESLPVTDTRLKTCVFSENLVFVLENSVFESPLPFSWHVKCYNALREISPALTQKLYTHNFDFRVLHSDIETHKQGATPFFMIRNFTWGLECGGKHYQGKISDASIHALDAVSRFFEALNQIPKDLRSSLYALKNDQQQTLASILKKLTSVDNYDGSCVESAAIALNSFLETQKKNPLLHVNITKQVDMTLSQERYQLQAREIIRETTQTEHYPFALVEIVAKTMIFENMDSLVYFLICFPTDLYAGILLNVHYNYLTRLAPAVNAAFFTEAQIIALFNVYLMKARQLGFEYCHLDNATSRALFNLLPASAHDDICRQFVNLYEMQYYAWFQGTTFDVSAHFERFSLAFKKTLLLSYLDILNLESTTEEKQKPGQAFFIANRVIFNENERNDIVEMLKRNLLIAVKKPDFTAFSHTLNMLVAFNAIADILTYVDKHNSNLLHQLLSMSQPDSSICVRELIRVVPSEIRDALLYMRDSRGKQPIEYVKSSADFLLLLQQIAPEKRLPLLLDANDQLHAYIQTLSYSYIGKYPKIDPQTIIYINLMQLLPWPAMVLFLTKTRHATVTILNKMLLLSHEELQVVKHEFPIALFNCINILIDNNINTKLLLAHFINLLTKQSDWLAIHNSLCCLLRSEITQPHFFTTHSSSNPAPLQALFRFYADHQIYLSPQDYYNAIAHYQQDACEYHAESRLALCVLAHVLNTHPTKRLALLTGDNQALFTLVNQLSVNSPEHKHRLFNPVLLLKMVASLGSGSHCMRERLDFRNLPITIRCLNASLFHNITFYNLMENNFFSILSTRFITSPFLAREVFQYFVNMHMGLTTTPEQTSAFIAGFTVNPDEKANWLSQLMDKLNKLELNPTHHPLVLERFDIFQTALNLYDFAINHHVTRNRLMNKVKEVLTPLSSIQRLIILFFQPIGEKNCLYEILMPDIQPTMKAIFENEGTLSLNVASIEESLLFSRVNLASLLDLLFNAHNTIYDVDIENAILHLLITRTEACLQLHKNKHLLIHYLNSSRARSHRMIRLLAQFPHHPRYEISQALLNTILACLTDFARHFPHDENTQTSIAKAIIILRNLGAVSAAELSDPECKAISRLLSKHCQHYQTLIDNYEDDEPVDQQFLYQDASCKIGLINTPIKSTIQFLELFKALGESTDMFSLTLQRREHLDICQQNDPLRKAYLGLIKTFFRPNTKEDLLRLLFPTYHQFLNLSITAGKLTLSPVPLPPDFRVPLTDTFYTKAEHDDWLQPYLFVDGKLIDLTTTPTLPEHFENTQNFCASTSFLLRIYDSQYHPTWRHYPVTFIDNLKFEHCHDKYTTFKFLESLHPDCFTKTLAVFLFEHRGPHHHYLVYKKDLSAFHPRQFLQLMKLYKEHCGEKHGAPHENFEKFVTLYESNLTPAMRKKYHCLTNKNATSSKGLFFNKAAPTQPSPNPERQQINHGN